MTIGIQSRPKRTIDGTQILISELVLFKFLYSGGMAYLEQLDNLETLGVSVHIADEEPTLIGKRRKRASTLQRRLIRVERSIARWTITIHIADIAVLDKTCRCTISSTMASTMAGKLGWAASDDRTSWRSCNREIHVVSTRGDGLLEIASQRRVTLSYHGHGSFALVAHSEVAVTTCSKWIPVPC